MNPKESPDPVEAARADIETTRAELVETVNELSDRLNPKKRVGAATESVTDNTKQAVEKAQGLAKKAATKTQDVARAGGGHIGRLVKRRPQLVAGTVVIAGMILSWGVRRRRR